MLVLHGAWKVISQAPPVGRLFVWAEASSGRPTIQPRDIIAGSRRPARHPFAASGDDVESVLFDLAQQAEVGRFYDVGPVATETIWLPTGVGRAGAPLPSPRLVFDDADHDGPDRGRARVKPWLVSGVYADLEIALRVLADVPLHATAIGPEISADDVVLGGDLRFWSHVAKFALELAARQRFVPTLTLTDPPPDPEHPITRSKGYAYWVPVLDDPTEHERLVALAAALPASAMAIAPAADRGKVTTQPRESVRHFLTTAIDTIVRWSNMAAYASTDRESDRLRSSSVHERWFRALHDEPRVTGTPDELHRFAAHVHAWSAEIHADGRNGGFRTCFRLEPPAPATDNGDPDQVKPVRGDPSTWHVRFFLQAIDDRSLLVPAEEVWRQPGRTLQFLERRFERPRQRFLADLGRAVKLFPEVEPALRSACPQGCTLTTEQAHTFLRETAWLLEDSGFGVLVPGWWSRRGMQSQKLGLRMNLRDATGTVRKQSQLGLNALVSYDWELALGDVKLTKDEFKRLAALKTPLVEVRGEWVELRPDQIDAIRKFWETQNRSEEMTLGQALRMSFGADEMVGPLPVLGVDATGKAAELLESIQDVQRIEEIPIPAAFNGTLRPYQARGLNWLVFLRKWGLGACLADDMGLGKTIQLLALLLHEQNNGVPNRPTLVVCPTSVVSNWGHEAARFSPDLRVMIHHGPDRLTDDDFNQAANQHDLVVTSYALVRRDHKFISTVDWNRVALDEAQMIKSVSARVTRCIRELKADHRVALTGTPVENRLSELWSILDFLNPGYLGTLTQFKRGYATPIERYEDPDATNQLKALVQPFILRRVKTDPDIISDLPDKQEMKVYCSLTREQATLYEAIVQESLQQIESSTGIRRKGVVLSTLLRLKQVCNHPAQYLQDESTLADRSGKLARLTEMLDELVTAGDHALVFTQFAMMGRLLRSHLQGLLGREVLFLHGGTTARRRDWMIDQFQTGDDAPPVFILSLKAGGIGLNLTRANHVFHYDRWWNPAVEDQATDRAFRIGQTKNVQVHKFVCAGTVEEQIDTLIESKKTLATTVVSAGEKWLTELSTEQLGEMLMLRPDAVLE
jgi:SNF2 family DNA or RNA helicase